MWQVIYITESKKMAEKVLDILSEEGFLCREKSTDDNSGYEIMVPESEFEEAVLLINDQELDD